MENKLYIVYDYDGVNTTPVYGVFTSMEKAIEACKDLVEDMVCDCLAEDPRPSYQDEPERIYGMAFGGYEIKFRVEQDILTVLSVETN